MTGIKTCVFMTALILALVSPSCSLFRRSKSKTPPAPQPAPTAQGPQTNPPPSKPQQVSLPTPPEVPPQQPSITQPPVPPEKLPPAPHPRTRRQPKRTQTTETPAPTPTTPEPATTPPPQPVPELVQILTPAQQQAYNEEIDRNIARAQRTVSALSGRRLNGEQQTYLDRIRTFVLQASEARKTDLFRAKNLAERAGLLADDLLKSFQ